MCLFRLFWGCYLPCSDGPHRLCDDIYTVISETTDGQCRRAGYGQDEYRLHSVRYLREMLLRLPYAMTTFFQSSSVRFDAMADSCSAQTTMVVPFSLSESISPIHAMTDNLLDGACRQQMNYKNNAVCSTNPAAMAMAVFFPTTAELSPGPPKPTRRSE